MMGDLILPRRLVVDGDVAIVPDTSGDLLFFRVDNGRVAELRVFEPKIGR
jgi:hypothetical protein